MVLLDDVVGDTVGIIAPPLVLDVTPVDKDADSGHAELGG